MRAPAFTSGLHACASTNVMLYQENSATFTIWGPNSIEI